MSVSIFTPQDGVKEPQRHTRCRRDLDRVQSWTERVGTLDGQGKSDFDDIYIEAMATHPGWQGQRFLRNNTRKELGRDASCDPHLLSA
jgi:hypothetical protein